MDRLVFSDVRCFRGNHDVRLAPITILVGENSTGKSTLLSLARVAWDIAFSRTEPDFNEDPFQLGAYDDIAHYHGGKGKRVTRFQIGMRLDTPAPGKRSEILSNAEANIVGTVEPEAGQPRVKKLEFSSGQVSVAAAIEASHVALQTRFGSDLSSFKILQPALMSLTNSLNLIDLGFLLDNVRVLQQNASHGQMSFHEGDLPGEAQLRPLISLLQNFRIFNFARHPGLGPLTRPYAIAPIRTKPKRTYDPLRESPSPEGDHVPMLLARLQSADEKRWAKVQASLERFGQASGLFKLISVKKFQDKKGTPFQIRFKLEGQQVDANLTDIGYGVSQVLPILVDCISAEEPTQFLMQQPEVHLHPRAQAELGTFISRLASTSRHRFLVETHSDFFLDRVRLEIKSGALAAKDVSIVFLERIGPAVQMHQLELDSSGSPVSVPESYRTFFLREEMKLLGLEP